MLQRHSLFNSSLQHMRCEEQLEDNIKSEMACIGISAKIGRQILLDIWWPWRRHSILALLMRSDQLYKLTEYYQRICFMFLLLKLSRLQVGSQPYLIYSYSISFVDWWRPESPQRGETPCIFQPRYWKGGGGGWVQWWTNLNEWSIHTRRVLRHQRKNLYPDGDRK